MEDPFWNIICNEQEILIVSSEGGFGSINPTWSVYGIEFVSTINGSFYF